MICTCAMHCPLSGYHERECCDRTTCDCWCHEKAEPRASRMPAHMKPIDPLFYDAAFRPFSPAEKEMVEEKTLPERARRAGL